MTELENLKDVLKSNILSGYKADINGHNGGKWCQRVEDQFKDYFGVKYALLMNSATSAIFVGLRACGVEPDDFVETTPLTFSASASTIFSTGANAVFADINRRTYNIKPFYVPYLKAILPVHLMGYPADMNEVCRVASLTGAKVIEDAAQAIGAKYKGEYVGTIGDCGVFSFNQGKQTQCGEGGILLTNNPEISYKVGMLRNHGETQSTILGFNFRMTELQAAVLSARFEKIDETLDGIRSICGYVNDELCTEKYLTIPFIENDCTHSYMYYALRISIDRMSRDDFQKKLAEQGVYFGSGGYKPLYYLPYYEQFKTQLPEVESAYKEVAFTNIFRPPISKTEVKRVIQAIKNVVK